MNINDDYQICATCILDTSDPEIVFDEAGVCNYCRAYSLLDKSMRDQSANSEALDFEVSEIKRRSKGKYDCIIGLSGGVDSTYVAYLVKKVGRLWSVKASSDRA